MSVIDSNPTDTDQLNLMIYHKRSVVKIGLFIGMPLVCALAINNFVKGNHLVALLDCTMFLILVLLGFVTTGRIDEKSRYRIYPVLFRLFIATVGIVVLYEIGFQSKFSRIEWAYIYPLLAFFAVGLKEGVIWVSIFYGVVAFFILNFDLQGITLSQIEELRSRFLVSFFTVCMLSLFLERGFRHAQERMLHHQGNLKKSENRYRQAYEQLDIEMQERKRAEEALRESETELRTIFESIQAGVLIIDPETHRIIDLNPAALKFIGVPKEKIVDSICHKFICPAEIGKCPISDLEQNIENAERILLTANGEIRQIIKTVVPILLGGRGHLLESFVDITERKQTEEALRESEERFRQLAENIREVFYIYEEGIPLYVSPAYAEIWGRPPQTLYEDPESFWETVHPEDRDRVERSLEKKSQQEVEVVYRIVHPDQSIRWIKDRSFPVGDDSGKTHRIVGIAADITDLKIGEEKLRYLSLHDPLTGLYNRVYFEEEMSRMEKTRDETVGILSCDVDGLKLVNDTLGHDQGDRLLIAAARVIRESFREGDLVARIGGDEFAVILPNTTEPSVENACQRIQEAVDIYNATTPELPLSISAGFSIKNGSHRNLKDVFKEADNHMYRKKLYRTQSVRSTLVSTLINTLKARDPSAERQAIRLEKLLIRLAAQIGLPESTTADFSLFARFHDIGKVGISDAILFKEGPFTSEEWTEMKRHSEIGYRIALSVPDLVPIADLILKHHEWWDGQGYPLGLKGEEIPIECRLLAIAGAYEALTSARPYRRTFSHREAVAELRRQAGRQFDPELLESFVKMLEAKFPESEFHPPAI
jgi:diguanylate cyclase (GGDEF)-like protein/PAS domain S-box-containing protein